MHPSLDMVIIFANQAGDPKNMTFLARQQATALESVGFPITSRRLDVLGSLDALQVSVGARQPCLDVARCDGETVMQRDGRTVAVGA